MWIFTKASTCKGQRHTDNFMMNKMDSITEAVKGAQEILYEYHESIPQNSTMFQENHVLETPNDDTEAP